MNNLTFFLAGLAGLSLLANVYLLLENWHILQYIKELENEHHFAKKLTKEMENK
jgi:hypothetical protein